MTRDENADVAAFSRPEQDINVNMSNPLHPFSQEIPDLLQRHFDDHILGSGIFIEIAIERGYRSILIREELADLGFSKSQRRTPTLLIPIHSVDGRILFHIHRPDHPRRDKNNKAIKYENPKGEALSVDCPPRCRENLENPNIRLWITEGVKKADALASRGECVIDLLGVHGYKHKNEFGAPTITADFDYIAWKDRVVYIVYDNDVMVNPRVKKALDVLTEHLRRKGAIVYHVYIPFANGKKVGVDDFLADKHTVEDLLSCAIKQDETHTNTTSLYYFDKLMGRLCRTKEIKGVTVPVPLANFDVRIVEELIHDNGLEISHFYKVDAKTLERNLGTIEVSAASFANMNWVYKLGVDAILEPGISTKDFVRHYVQMISKPKRVTAYTHTGWRKIDDQWAFLSAGGAIGKEDLTVSLADELRRYSLPQAPVNETESIKFSLSFLDLGLRRITLPLLSFLYLSPLTTLLSPLPNFSLFSYGRSGVFKTTLAMLMLAHFGNFDSIQDLSNFEDTPNALGRRAFTLKDTLMVVDDYHPSTQRHLAQQKESIAQRLIREFANRTERGRLNSDSSEKPRYSPRGMLLVTGEELLSLQSTLARVCVIEIAKGDIDKDRLRDLQNQAYNLPHAMSSYINWLRHVGIENIQTRFKDVFFKFRTKASIGRDLLHSKLLEQIAFLQFSLVNVLDWMLDKGVISESQARELRDEGWKVFCELAAEHDRRIHAEDPVAKFIDILSSLIIQRKVRIESKEDSGAPIGGSAAEDRAELIGYFDKLFLYLLPSPLWNAVQKFCSSSNEHFPASKNTLFRMLAERKLIETRDGEGRFSLRTRDGVIKVIKLARGVVLNDASTMSTEIEIDV